MNKGELIAAIAAKAEISKVAAAKALEAALDATVEALKKGEAVQVIGFGTLKVAEKAARKGINPATKETITIPAHEKVTFKASDNLNIFSRKHGV